MDPRNRRKLWIVFLTTVFLCTLLLLVCHRRNGRSTWTHTDDLFGGPLIVEDRRECEAHGVLVPAKSWEYKPSQAKYAYVSLLCDDSALPQARVLAHSIRKVKSEYPLVFMTLPYVTKTDELLALGAEIEKIPLVQAPFTRPNGKRPAFATMCKYSKIHAWSLTRFEKAVFIDTNLLVVNVRLILLFLHTYVPVVCRTSMKFSSTKSFQR